MNSASIGPALEPQQFPSGAIIANKPLDFDIIRSLRMERKLVFIVMAAVFVLVFGFGLSRRPYFETQALIYVQPERSKLITDPTDGSYDSPRYETYIQQQLQTIIRSDVLAEALSDPHTRAWRYPGEPLQVAIVRLQHSLKVERVTESYELSIDLSGSDPHAIAAVVNAVCEAYIRSERADELAQSDQQLQILQDELKRVSNDLDNDRKQQAELSVSLGVADTTGDSGNPYDIQLGELRTELGKAMAAHDVAAAQVAAMGSDESGITNSARVATDEMVASDPGLMALKSSIGQRRSILESQMSGLTPKNPLFQQDQEELDRLDQTLTEMEAEVRNKDARQLQQKLQLESRRTEDIVARIQQQLAERTAIATNATPQLQHASDLAADIVRLQARYNEVDNAINAIELEKNTSGLVHLIAPAEAPIAPKTSTKRLILGVSFPLALGLGLLAGILMRRLDTRVYAGPDVARVVQFYPIAVLPAASLGETLRDEYILRLVAGVDQIHRTDDARTFLFTAASPGSETSSLIAALAVRMEHLGYKVVTLKGSDLVRSPDAFQKSATELLPNAPRTIEANDNENFVLRNIHTITRDVDMLFIDGLPLLSSSESEFLARLSDVAILIIESGLSYRGELESSLSLIKRLRLPGTAVVLTEVELANADSDFIESVRNSRERLHPDDAHSEAA